MGHQSRSAITIVAGGIVVLAAACDDPGDDDMGRGGLGGDVIGRLNDAYDAETLDAYEELLPSIASPCAGGEATTAIAWSSFTAPRPTDDDSRRLEEILNNAARFGLTTWYDELKNFDAQTGPYLAFDAGLELQIRHPASEAMALAIALALDVYDPAHTGVPTATAEQRAIRLLTSVAHHHRSNSPDGWGAAYLADPVALWQTAHWAMFAGTAGWLLWDRLDDTDAEYVCRMVEAEARRLVGYQVPYYQDRDGMGPFHVFGDTKAEENAWNAQLLFLAVTMMPGHPQRAAWEYKAAELAISAYSQPDDLAAEQPVSGRPLGQWLSGSNVNPDGVVVNHYIAHPDYMAAAVLTATAPIWYGLARRATPDATFHGVDRVYQALVDLEWSPGASYPGTRCTLSCECDQNRQCIASAPGGTIYVADSDQLYFPHGTDWGTGRRMNFATLDVVARHFGLDGLVAVKAEVWERLHAQAQLDLQRRSADGRTYIELDEDTYHGREEWVASHAGWAIFVKSIVAQGGYQRSSAAIPVVVDNRDREFSVTGTWVPSAPGDALGEDLVWHSGAGSFGRRRARWHPLLPAGRYRVSAWWNSHPDHAADAPYRITHRDGTTTVVVDQATGGNRWNPLGTFDFDGTASTGYVELWNRSRTGHVAADAVMFEPMP